VQTCKTYFQIATARTCPGHHGIRKVWYVATATGWYSFNCHTHKDQNLMAQERVTAGETARIGSELGVVTQETGEALCARCS
jgi:hypothetical protein